MYAGFFVLVIVQYWVDHLVPQISPTLR